MSGHSKWSTIKRKKGLIDSQRGRIFTKLVRELIVAAKNGGGSPDSNARLRVVITKAKEVNMPADNIKRAIQKGTGELEGVNYEEIRYEGYGPGGIAIMVDSLTDNKNRTASEIRSMFSKNGGNMGESGCVSWMFERKGYITVDKNKIAEDELMTIVLDAGAEDMKIEEDSYEIITLPEDFDKVKVVLQEKKIEMSTSEITMIPKNYVTVEGKDANQLLNLIDTLEANDDVQQVYGNFDISEKILEEREKTAA
ncbi:MAG: YebC/PmpR family DNA-binding transcriptional regulator [Candidatus Firestonebacteria bacterium]